MRTSSSLAFMQPSEQRGAGTIWRFPSRRAGRTIRTSWTPGSQAGPSSSPVAMPTSGAGARSRSPCNARPRSHPRSAPLRSNSRRTPLTLRVGRAMRIYYGWFIVAMSVVIFTLLLGTTYHAFGVFVVPVSRDLGLSRAEINTALILFSIGNAIWAPIVGQMLARLAIRPIMLGCALLMGASLVALGLSDSASWSAIVLGAPLAFAMQGAGVLTANTLVVRWFSVHRGRAMAIALTGMS